MIVDKLPISHPVNVDAELRQLRTFLGSFDKLFTIIAEQLPNLAARLSSLMNRINAETDGTSENSILPSLNHFSRVGMQFRDEIAVVSTLNGKIAQATQGVAAEVEGLIGAIAAINRSSVGLAYTAINASAAAGRLGDEGSAFGALTKELGQQSERAIRQAGGIKTAANGVRKVSSDLERLRCGLEDSFESLSTIQSARAEATIHALIESVNSFTNTLRETHDRGAVALSAIRNVMNSIQRQDILRQGIEHIIMVLQETGSAPVGHDPAEQLAFRNQAGSLAANLIGNIREDLRTLLAEVLSEFSELKDATERLVNAQDDAAKQLTARLQDQANSSKESAQAVNQAVKVFDDYQLANDSLHSFVRNLSPNLRELEAVAEYLRTVEILIKIEVARTDNLMRASSIAQEVTATRKSMELLVEAAVERKVELAEHLAWVHTAVVNVSARRDTLVSASERAFAQSQTTRLEATKYLNAIGTLAAEGRNVAGLTSSFIHKLNIFLTSEAELSSTEQACLALANQAQAQLTLLGRDGKDFAPTERLKDLVQKFTVLSHKEVAATVMDFEVEQGDDGGTLTLF